MIEPYAPIFFVGALMDRSAGAAEPPLSRRCRMRCFLSSRENNSMPRVTPFDGPRNRWRHFDGPVLQLCVETLRGSGRTPSRR